MIEFGADAALAVGIAWFLICGLLVNVACVVNGRWVKRCAAPGHAPAGGRVPRRFLFIVPTIGESSVLAALDALERLDAPDACEIEIVVVGSARSPGAPSDADAAVEAFTGGRRRTRHRVRALTDPSPTGTKPDRLNFVLNTMRPSVDGFDYVVMVDSDTEVPSDLVPLMMHAAAGDSADEWPVLLQPMLRSIAGDGAGISERAEAMMHTRWRLGYECTLLRLAHRAGSRTRRRWAPLTYGVGCCLAVRADQAVSFPSPAEDLRLGYKLSGHGLAVAPVRAVVLTRTKQTPRGIAERHSMWFRYSYEALRRDPGCVRDGGLRENALVTLERLRLLAWVPGPLLFGCALALQALATAPAEAALRASLLLALSVLVYLTVGLSLWLGGDRRRDGTGVADSAACLVRWTWSAVLPMWLLGRERAVRLRIAATAGAAAFLIGLAAAVAGRRALRRNLAPKR